MKTLFQSKSKVRKPESVQIIGYKTYDWLNKKPKNKKIKKREPGVQPSHKEDDLPTTESFARFFLLSLKRED